MQSQPGLQDRVFLRTSRSSFLDVSKVFNVFNHPSAIAMQLNHSKDIRFFTANGITTFLAKLQKITTP